MPVVGSLAHTHLFFLFFSFPDFLVSVVSLLFQRLPFFLRKNREWAGWSLPGCWQRSEYLSWSSISTTMPNHSTWHGVRLSPAILASSPLAASQASGLKVSRERRASGHDLSVVWGPETFIHVPSALKSFHQPSSAS